MKLSSAAAPMKFVNYGVAVVAMPLGLASSMGSPVTEAPQIVRTHVRSGASSDMAQRLDDEWAELRMTLGRALERSAVRRWTEDISWYETPDSAAYPLAANLEVLDVPVADDAFNSAFTFTDTDFDVWAD